MTRRCFLGSLVASAGAAAWAKARLGAPDLRVGILSDIHLSPAEMYSSRDAIDMFVLALEFYKRQSADVVLIAGDFTNGGRMIEMRVVADCWCKVFGSITSGPVKVWVTGNHERNYFVAARDKGDTANPQYADGLYRDIKKNWRDLFGENWSPFFIKKVKGYAFVGAHWAEWREREKALRDFLAAHKAELDPSRPFFYTQHAHPQNTCYGPWTWDQSAGGRTAEILADYPNAVAFSGHTHYSLTDERSIWQGAFTSIGTGALRWQDMPYGRENNRIVNGEGQRMPQACSWVKQGMILSVWGDEMVFERYDIQRMEKLGDDWIVPVLHGRDDPRPYAFDKRRAESAAPEFPPDAKIGISRRRGKANALDPKSPEEDQVVVTFPAAVGRGDSLSRTYDYEVVCEYVESDVVLPVRTKRVYQPGVNMNERHAAKTVDCVFGAVELPVAPYRWAVTPMNAFGRRGRTIWSAAQKPEKKGC